MSFQNILHGLFELVSRLQKLVGQSIMNSLVIDLLKQKALGQILVSKPVTRLDSSLTDKLERPLISFHSLWDDMRRSLVCFSSSDLELNNRDEEKTQLDFKTLENSHFASGIVRVVLGTDEFGQALDLVDLQ